MLSVSLLIWVHRKLITVPFEFNLTFNNEVTSYKLLKVFRMNTVVDNRTNYLSVATNYQSVLTDD